jgi:hypothetical protein
MCKLARCIRRDLPPAVDELECPFLYTCLFVRCLVAVRNFLARVAVRALRNTSLKMAYKGPATSRKAGPIRRALSGSESTRSTQRRSCHDGRRRRKFFEHTRRRNRLLPLSHAREARWSTPPFPCHGHSQRYSTRHRAVGACG